MNRKYYIIFSPNYTFRIADGHAQGILHFFQSQFAYGFCIIYFMYLDPSFAICSASPCGIPVFPSHLVSASILHDDVIPECAVFLEIRRVFGLRICRLFILRSRSGFCGRLFILRSRPCFCGLCWILLPGRSPRLFINRKY